MSIVKVIEVLATSETSFDDAVKIWSDSCFGYSWYSTQWWEPVICLN